MSLGGRTLVLRQMLRAIAVIAQVLRQQLSATGFILGVLAQRWPKLRLMERFRAGQNHRAAAFIRGFRQFWEGFDVPGTRCNWW